MKIKNIITPSGNRGWQAKLQDVYKDLGEFKAFNRIYQVAKRLGYSSAISAWRNNPIIQGSIYPSDLRRVTKK